MSVAQSRLQVRDLLVEGSSVRGLLEGLLQAGDDLRVHRAAVRVRSLLQTVSHTVREADDVLVFILTRARSFGGSHRFMVMAESHKNN
ncbi:hypothetical protein B447_04883 [Thauera sp. 27]|nr:hypothetical protein B447_04883 [Thauera sp. 27]